MRLGPGVLIAALAVVALAGAALWYARSTEAGDGRVTDAPVSAVEQDTSARAPADVRVRVRVLNGTSTSGLARRGTQRLRDHGYDVVDYSTAPKPSAETLIDVTAASREWGARIARALGAGAVREQPEPLPHADVVVTLGSDWKPPPQPFRP